MTRKLQAIELSFNSVEDMRLDFVIDGELYLYRGHMPGWFIEKLGASSRQEVQEAIEEYIAANKRVDNAEITENEFESLDLKIRDMFVSMNEWLANEQEEAIKMLSQIVENPDADLTVHLNKNVTAEASNVLAQYQSLQMLEYQRMMSKPMQEKEHVDLDKDMQKQLSLATGKGSA